MTPRRVRTFAIATCESGCFPRGRGKTKSQVRDFDRLSRTIMALPESGTLCSRPAFMRGARIVQTFSCQVISDHFAPRISPVRVAVRMQTSSASRSDTEICAYLLHQGGDVPVRHRCVVTALELWPFRQKVGQVTAPSGRVFP